MARPSPKALYIARALLTPRRWRKCFAVQAFTVTLLMSVALIRHVGQPMSAGSGVFAMLREAATIVDVLPSPLKSHEAELNEVYRSLNRENAAAPGSCKHNEMTIVSGYFNIGSFRKGSRLVYTVEDYRNWTTAFRYIRNPVIFFTNDRKMAALVLALRSKHELEECTIVQVIRPQILWGFRLIPNISAVISKPNYPKFYPNTVVPEYPAVMHSKYAMLELALRANPFNSEYFAWMDSGLFREANVSKSMLLLPPPGFDDSMVAFNEVFSPIRDLSIRTIFLNDSIYFVGGGFFVATRRVMTQWCAQYKSFTEYFLQQGFSHTDQQVIYSMFTDEVRMKKKAEVNVLRYFMAETTYHQSIPFQSWYHLRDLSVDEGARRMQRIASFGSRASTGQSKSKPKVRPQLTTTKPPLPNATATPSACRDDTVIVTGYMNIGSVAIVLSEDTREVRTPAIYQRWLNKFGNLRNPVVVYSDDVSVLAAFEQVRVARQLGNCTFTRLINRTDLWSWRTVNKIASILARSLEYPSAIPEYIAALHSKFAILEMAVADPMFNRSTLTWLDVSAFRNWPADGSHFTLHLKQVGRNAVGVSIVDPQASSRPADSNAICSASVLTRVLTGSSDMIRAVSQLYRSAVQMTLAWKIVLRDDQLLSAAYCWRNVSVALERSNAPSMEPLFVAVSDADWHVAFNASSNLELQRRSRFPFLSGVVASIHDRLILNFSFFSALLITCCILLFIFIRSRRS